MSERPAAMNRDPDYRTIEEKAAEWFGRCELGLNREQEREFMVWLEADARHGEAMREMDETWQFLDKLKEIRQQDRAEPKRTQHPLPLPFAPLGGRRAMLFTAAAAAIALCFFAVRHPWEPASMVSQAATDSTGMKKMELPDGSVIHLNASSDVEVRLSNHLREVQLTRGEAHFTVAKDSSRPFVVTAGGVAVKAVGTAFDVRRAEHQVEIFVTEGKVRIDGVAKGESLLPRPVNAASAEPLLVAGERVTVLLDGTAASPAITPITPAEMQQALAWQARQLDFDRTPLAEIVTEFNRFNTHQLVIAEPELGNQPFGGSFRADNYDVFVRLLEARFGVRAERNDDRTILRRAR